MGSPILAAFSIKASMSILPDGHAVFPVSQAPSPPKQNPETRSVGGGVQRKQKAVRDILLFKRDGEDQ
jgi:hypothetical protein